MALVVYGSTKMESKSTVEVEEKMDEVHPSVGLGLNTSTSSNRVEIWGWTFGNV